MSSTTTHPFDDHTQAHTDVTVCQLTLAIAGIVALVVYFVRLPGRLFKVDHGSASVVAAASQPTSANESTTAEKEKFIAETNGEVKVDLKTTEIEDTSLKKSFTKVLPPPTLDEFLSYCCQFFFILIVFWISDYRKSLPAGERVYSKDVFLFLVFILFLVATSFTMRKTSDVILNREQTEEWKGWMQVMFVWYHYFHAYNWYNWIRVYIAAYVWMTGFGNFSFFWLKKDYSLWRVAKMLFRLNFFVLVLCATLANDYMLYYICAMHTYWFFSVYATMSIAPQLNYQPRAMAAKFAVYAILNFLVFDVTGAAEYVFRPLSPVLGYTDPTHGIMHEWVFRAGLDHWACFFGMLCAYNYPHYETFLRSLEQKVSQGRQYYEHLVKSCMAICIVVALYAWYCGVMVLDKYAYNRLHPYTSVLPVIGFVVLRNLYPCLRTRYLFMFNWLGKITLETYLTQLHLYLQSNAKELIVYIPNYPLLNFSLATIIYLAVSHQIFSITTCFSAFLVPHDTSKMKRNLAGTLAVLAMSCATAFTIKSM